MQDLTPVGLSKDRRRLVLISASGVEYSVEIDQKFRSVLRGDQARLGQLEMTMESTLRPRDIQARIRAGESAEEVAAAANTTVDRIMGFAGPVLAERAHIASSAQLASVRRRSGDSGARTLQDSAAASLHEVGVRLDDVVWDAWRRDDGRWEVRAEFNDGGRQQQAEFTYDTRGRFVVAENEAAHFLIGESRPAERTSATPRRRLAAVRADQDELPLGDDAIEMVRETADADWMTPDEPVDDVRPSDAAPEAEAVEDAEAEQASKPEQTEQPDETSETTDSPAAPAAEVSEPAETPAKAASEQPVNDEEPTVEVAPARKRKGRASVPSWDEIMFGGGGSE